jgi:hypothetical protein
LPLVRRDGAGGRADTGDDVAHLCMGLAPQCVNIGMLAGDLDRRVGSAAEIDRDARALNRPYFGGGAGETIIGTLVIDRAIGGPDRFQDADIFVGTGVALVLVQIIAVALLVDIVAAGDNMDRGTPLAQLIERREAAGCVGRCLKTWPMGDQEPDPARMGRDMGGNLQPIRSVRIPTDQKAVESALIMCLGRGAQIAKIDRFSLCTMDFRLLARLDHADEFDGRGCRHD